MKQGRFFNELIIFAILFMTFLPFVANPLAAFAHTREDEILKGVGVDEKLNARVPIDLHFTNLAGSNVKLADYIAGKPVILTLNYYSCPMLCPLTFRNLTETMNGLQGLSLNRDFRVVTVSIDPDESLSLMKEKASETYGGLKGITDPEQRWPFLMGKPAEIDSLTKAVGLRYVQLGKNNFAHPSVSVVLTPDGRVSRYLYGVEIAPSDLKLALIEAADGKIGGSRILNRVLLYCFHYDPVEKKYAVTAVNLMKITGAAILAMLVILIVVLKRTEKRKAEGS
jgi:protein SCO1/2